MTNYHLLKPHSLVIPQESGLVRDTARAPELQDPTYCEKYDFKTIFYDMMLDGEEIICVGPPLLNLERELVEGEILLNDDPTLPLSFSTKAVERGQITRLTLPQTPSHDSSISFHLACGEKLLSQLPPPDSLIFRIEKYS